jgi:hypothetical protein
VMNAVAQTQPNGETRFQRPATNRGKAGDQHDRRVIDALTAAAMVHSYMAAQMSTPKASGWRGL